MSKLITPEMLQRIVAVIVSYELKARQREVCLDDDILRSFDLHSLQTKIFKVKYVFLGLKTSLKV